MRESLSSSEPKLKIIKKTGKKGKLEHLEIEPSEKRQKTSELPKIEQPKNSNPESNIEIAEKRRSELQENQAEIDDILNQITELWKEDDGFALKFKGENGVAERKIAELDLKEQEIFNEIHDKQTALEHKKFFRGKLENQVKELTEQLEAVREQKDRIKKKIEDTLKHFDWLSSRLSLTVKKFGEAILKTQRDLGQSEDKLKEEYGEAPEVVIHKKYPFLKRLSHVGDPKFFCYIGNYENFLAERGYVRRKQEYV